MKPDDEGVEGSERQADAARRAPLDADENPDFAEEYDHASGVLDDIPDVRDRR